MPFYNYTNDDGDTYEFFFRMSGNTPEQYLEEGIVWEAEIRDGVAWDGPPTTFVKDGKTYAGTTVAESQKVILPESFRGHKIWHRYSDKQIEVLKNWILYIADRDNIDVRAGLVDEIKKNGAKGFEFNENAYYGRIKGMWTHTNTRKDKVDMFPQPELIDMLLSL